MSDETQRQVPQNLPEITTLRLPIFCRENKPFIFIKVMDDSEKYRISVNPDFLKNYNLNFKILRDLSLDNFMSSLRPNLKNILKRGTMNEDPNSISNVSIFLRLPEKEKFPIQKHTIVSERDNRPGRTLIDKYQIIFDPENGSNAKKNVLYIIERNYKGLSNISITFVSEQFTNIYEFLEAYALNTGINIKK